jgi:murein DD-endopeptidase
MSIRQTVMTLAAALALAAPASAQAPAQIIQGFDVQIPFAPTLVEIGRQRQLVYELHLTNFASRPLRLDRLEILASEGNALGTFEGEALGTLIGRVGPAAAEARLITPGERVTVYIDLPLTASPRAVRHSLNFSRTDGASSTAGSLSLDPVALSSTPLPVLGPPLRGGPWVAVYEPGMERGHRRVVYATEGAARIPGRFAIDFIQVDAQGRAARGDGARVDDHFGYGAEVLAVADGIVVAVRNDFSEPARTAESLRVSIGDATGNYVALDIGGGRYAFYEHLRPGVPVRLGERVRRGQVIGQLGFTGQASGPHLHFHLADANSPLNAEGMPYAMTGFEPIGRYDSIAAFGRGGPWNSLPPFSGRARPSMPSPNMVVRFANR